MVISTRGYAAAAFVGLAVVLTATYFVTVRSGDRFGPCRASLVAGGAGSVGGPFTLTDQAGRRVTDREVLAGPSLVYFGYTFCPDVCPVDAARNAEAVDILQAGGQTVTPVFISVDPRRDTPERLAEFTGFLHPQMIGLTGSEVEIAAVVRAYRSYSMVPESPADDYYLVDHMTHTYLMLPGVGFVEFFRNTETAEELARRTACFLDAA